MSKLGYFIGGALAGIIGTAIAAYAVDACASSDTDAAQELDADESGSALEGDGTTHAESFSDSVNEESCTA